MILHPYETTALQSGWDCTHCGSLLEPGATHYVNPDAPDAAYCREQCAEDNARRESRKTTSNPRQVALAL